MSRRRAAERRQVLPDPIYGHPVVAKFINVVTTCGKKSIAEKIVYYAIAQLAEKLKCDAMEIFEKIVENVRPILEVSSKRIGGATYQVPVEVRPERSVTLALKFLVSSAKSRKSEKGMAKRLFGEMLDAYSGKGGGC
ncbi:30S ribosomal protein S7 [Candidatus Cyrtobacter comes]|uniref:30S ribosomal protein S7 n=1 Tax=Candidatus Cyrtobacter comes TaxID=675776 RepID=A0ABU5L6G6_9RICK|nr:30S ribosomal protein S7 [Candidatus Cyrtobacter comes]